MQMTKNAKTLAGVHINNLLNKNTSGISIQNVPIN